VKVEVASNEKLVRSGSRKRNKSIKVTEKKREKHRPAYFSHLCSHYCADTDVNESNQTKFVFILCCS